MFILHLIFPGQIDWKTYSTVCKYKILAKIIPWFEIQAMSPGKGYSFQTGHRNSFGVVDIVVFCIVLSFSAFIGIFFAVKVRTDSA